MSDNQPQNFLPPERCDQCGAPHPGFGLGPPIVLTPTTLCHQCFKRHPANVGMPYYVPPEG